ncbi:uncharacterized protein LOC131686757 [Topomyia yanbarensis]|uniref:uncharacterized protein LOC131686757 n=1 Tax=Topomyia yanbarensis TaxID=2498891 RepID=UPI00273CAA7D|nr:uncharacterized protein LOC131686757 [Topomyia yanbarensis]
MDTDDVICVECKKRETDSNKLVTCLYCFKSAHYKCRNIIGNAVRRVKENMYFCTPNCSDIYKKIIEMKTNKSDIVAALGSELKITVASAVACEMQNLRAEFKSITSAIENSQDFLSTKFDSIVSDFRDLKSENEALKQEISSLRKKQSCLYENVNKLEMNLDKTVRDNVSNNAIFLGVPFLCNENTVELVMKIAHCIGANLDRSSVVSAERLSPGKKATNSLVPIKVVFTDRTVKEILFTKKKEFGRLISTSIDDSLVINGKPTNVAIRDELTPLCLELLNEMRERQEFLNIKYVWSGRGVVLVKKNEKAKPEIIRNRNDLNRITSLYSNGSSDAADSLPANISPSPKRKRTNNIPRE